MRRWCLWPVLVAAVLALGVFVAVTLDLSWFEAGVLNLCLYAILWLFGPTRLAYLLAPQSPFGQRDTWKGAPARSQEIGPEYLEVSTDIRGTIPRYAISEQEELSPVLSTDLVDDHDYESPIEIPPIGAACEAPGSTRPPDLIGDDEVNDRSRRYRPSLQERLRQENLELVLKELAEASALLEVRREGIDSVRGFGFAEHEVIASSPERDLELVRLPHLEVLPNEPFVPGDDFEVEIYADNLPFSDLEQGDPLRLRTSPQKRRLDIDVWLTVSEGHLEIEGPAVARISLFKGSDRTSHATFSLRVRPDASPEGAPVITALFSHDGRASGRVSREVALLVGGRVIGRRPVAGSQKPPSALGFGSFTGLPEEDFPSSVEQPDRPRPRSTLALSTATPADLSVHIVKAGGARSDRYQCRVTTKLLPEFARGAAETWSPPENLESWVSSRLEDFASSGETPRSRRIALLGAGREFFKVAPGAFQEAFWQIIDSGQSIRPIAIVSDEPHLPWELMLPSRRRPDGTEEERPLPLGVECLVGRWTGSDQVAPPQIVRLKDSFVVAPEDSGLRHAAREAELVLASFPGDRISPATINNVDTSLAQGPRTLLHFACHGDREEQGQILRLEKKEPLRDYSLRELKGLRSFLSDSRALVFLNACELGATDKGLAGLSGFPRQLMELRAGAVIAALWAVKDSLAHEVAKAFYERVLAEPETPFAQIIADLRRRSYEEAGGEDTWAAYCFYGDPLASMAAPKGVG